MRARVVGERPERAEEQHAREPRPASSARASAKGTAQKSASPPAMPTSAKGAIQPKISGCTRNGSTIQKSAAAK